MNVLLGPIHYQGQEVHGKVKHFACKLATKCWDASYEEPFELPTLKERWDYVYCTRSPM